ncbi:MAG: nitrous oxide reductase accessory protein NosL [Sulfurovum sp.]|nr:nitrous oxide reductase accessory protein NosL [Sulfurovum sp.]MDD3602734.1 nitrous oxide reductase accessory protein NosL [Sulfurovum sp.]
MKILLVLMSFFVLISAEPIKTTKDDICLIRKLKVYKAPTWVSKITMKNGKVALFCSPKSMFDFYFDPSRFEEYELKDNLDIAEILVTDYNTLEAIDATKAYFVFGSSNISPAGDDLPAFSSEEDAKKYMKEHNGKRILNFKEVTKGLIDYLNM